MKTFEQVVDDLWKPVRMRLTIGYDEPSWGTHWRYQKDEILESSYENSIAFMKPYYGKTIGIPVEKICRRILNSPQKFRLLKQEDYPRFQTQSLSGSRLVNWSTQERILEIEDMETHQKFATDSSVTGVTYPDLFTKDEQRLLYFCIQEWYAYTEDLRKEDKLKEEKERKNELRQKLINLYEGY